MDSDAAVSSDSNAASSAEPRPGRFFHHRLRRASFISPITGLRSKRNFTLRDASRRPGNGASESTPLLSSNGPDGNPSKTTITFNYLKGHWRDFWQFADSKNGRGIFKCSLAYLLGSLVTFVPALAGMIGSRQNSKHMVATVTVWFHPARTIGNMHMATVLAVFGFLYSGIIGFSSMGVSLFFRSQDLLTTGHVVVLIIFVGGGMGTIAWVKQHFGDPLVNVATSLASLGCVTILIKEGSVQAGEVSIGRVTQVLEMVLIGVIIATAVNVLVLPVTARRQFRQDFEKNTDLLGECLICITRAFISGREDDIQDDYYTNLQKEYQQSSQKMVKDLGEGKSELYVLGRERVHQVSVKLTDCLEGLSQDLGGLRSAALAQFALVNSTTHESYGECNQGNGGVVKDRRPSWYTATKQTATRDDGQMSNTLDVITEAPDESFVNSNVLESPTESSTLNLPSSVDRAGGTFSDRRASIESTTAALNSPADMFYTFIRQLGPPTTSLVYTLKQILDELPYKKHTEPQSSLKHWWVPRWIQPDVEIAINENFHTSLHDAVNLYRDARKEALCQLYESRALSAAFMPESGRNGGAFSKSRTSQDKANGSTVRSAAALSGSNLEQPPEEVLADAEEVSACCGHFSFALLDFAEDVLEYLQVLDDLKDAIETPTRTWKWLMFWQWSWQSDRLKTFHGAEYEHGDEHGQSHDIPEPIRKADEFADPEKGNRERPWYYEIYRVLQPLRRDDVRFAIKVGIGALVYSLPAYIDAFRPFFVRWRGEWGLVSYMAVCCMTIGASNTTGINRFIGTFIGACLAIIAWILAADDGDANPYLLAFFGWVVSTACFYLIIAKGQGPMGRFILLTYNLGALYAYSLSVSDDDDGEDEGGIDPAIWDIVMHRLVAVMVGAIWGIVITRLIWPISARRKLQSGLSILWLRMGLVWKRDPLAMFLLGEPRSSYMDIREEAQLQSFLTYLDSLRSAASSEFELQGPFPDKIVSRIIERTRRMLNAFHAMNVLITKNLHCTPGEAAVLRYTREQRFALSARISHLFSVMASSFKLEYPLNDVLPSIETSRDRLLAQLSEFRRTGEGRGDTTEQDYELLYAYVLVTGQLAQDIQATSSEIENLFGTLNEENLKLQ